MQRKLTTTLEIEVEVDYTPHSACKAHRDEFGHADEPDDTAYIEIHGVRVLSDFVTVKVAKDGNPFAAIEFDSLLQQVQESIEEEAMQILSEA